MLKSKIHRATVSDCDLHYVGSITIDPELLEAADIMEFEQVAVVDVDNGARFETYTIAGAPGSGDMKVNGAAARLVHRGDTIIVISYGDYDPDDLEHYNPRVVHVDAHNEIVTVDSEVAKLLESATAAGQLAMSSASATTNTVAGQLAMSSAAATTNAVA
jgi:aspartate 1-decarboxylase